MCPLPLQAPLLCKPCPPQLAIQPVGLPSASLSSAACHAGFRVQGLARRPCALPCWGKSGVDLHASSCLPPAVQRSTAPNRANSLAVRGIDLGMCIPCTLQSSTSRRSSPCSRASTLWASLPTFPWPRLGSRCACADRRAVGGGPTDACGMGVAGGEVLLPSSFWGGAGVWAPQPEGFRCPPPLCLPGVVWGVPDQP